MQLATTSRFAVKLEALPRTGSCHHLSPVSLLCLMHSKDSSPRLILWIYYTPPQWEELESTTNLAVEWHFVSLKLNLRWGEQNKWVSTFKQVRPKRVGLMAGRLSAGRGLLSGGRRAVITRHRLLEITIMSRYKSKVWNWDIVPCPQAYNHTIPSDYEQVYIKWNASKWLEI